MAESSPAAPLSPVRPFSLPVLRRAQRLLLPLFALMAAGVLIAHLRDRSRDRDLARRDASSAVRLQRMTLERELEVAESLLKFLADQEVLQRHLDGEVARERVES